MFLHNNVDLHKLTVLSMSCSDVFSGKRFLLATGLLLYGYGLVFFVCALHQYTIIQRYTPLQLVGLYKHCQLKLSPQQQNKEKNESQCKK